MSFESAKKYGYIASMINVLLPVIAIITCIGAIALLVYQILTKSIVASITFVTGFLIGFCIILLIVVLIALILFLLSMYRLSNYYKEPKIFRNILYGYLITIIGSSISYSVGAIIRATNFITIPNLITELPIENGTSTFMQLLANFVAFSAVTICITIICGIISAILWFQAFNKLGEKSNIEKFKTTGLLYLIGVATQFTGIGLILIWISWIFATQGYKQLKPQQTINNNTQTYQPTVNFDKIYCSQCGTENTTNTIYCKHCGQPITQLTQTNTTP